MELTSKLSLELSLVIARRNTLLLNSTKKHLRFLVLLLEAHGLGYRLNYFCNNSRI